MSSLQKRLGQAGGHEQVTATAALAKMNEKARPIRLSDITLNLDFQFRLDVNGQGLDETHVNDLIHVISEGGDTDPVILYRVANQLLMVDGFHRYEAYRRENRPSIPAILRDGTYEEAEIAAENANLPRKLKLGDESRKYIFARRVERDYQTNGISWRQLSDKAIGAELFVSYKTVSRWFDELESGVTFVTPSKQEVLIQVACDRSVVYGRDGNPINVQAIREANTQRAEADRERRAAEEAERKNNLSGIEKLRVAVELLMAQYPRKPFFDDQEKGLEWCRQATSLVMDVELERNFLREYKAKPVGLYLDFLRYATGVIWDRAEDEAWTDDQISDWIFANKPRHTGFGQGKPPETFQQTGMAQPKNPNVEVPQPQTLGRHHAGATPSVAATEPVTENTASSRWSEGNLVWGIHPKALFRVVFVMHYPEVKNYRYTVETPDGDTVGRTFWEHELRTPTEQELKDATEPAAELFKPRPSCPFWIGTNVQVIETGERGIVQHTEYADDEWQIRVELYDGLKTFKVHEIERPFREQVDEALSFPSMGAATAAILDEAASELPDELDDDEVNTNPPPCPYHPGDVVKYLPNEMKCELLDTKWDGHVWWLLVRDENDQEWDAPINQFERVGVLLDSHAPPPAVDGAYWVDDDLEGDGVDNIDEKIQYFDAHPEEASEALRQRYNIPAPPQNGKRQAEMMVEDARTIVPRLVMDSTHAAVDFRSTTLVRWESPKSIETIVASADKKELKLLKRELERAIAEFNAVTQGSQRASSRCQDMLRQIRPYCE